MFLLSFFPFYYTLNYISNALILNGGYSVISGDGTKPLYIQISEWLENEILRGTFTSDEKVHSQYQLAEMFNINPATAAKGLNKLANEKILYKKRGLGMFVVPQAKETILVKRKNETLKQLITDLLLEAKRLDVSEEELIEMIKSANSEDEGDLL